MLHAEDRDKGGTRNFLLRRIVTPITTTNTRYEPVDASAMDAAIAELDEVWQQREAHIEAEPGSDAATRLGKRRGTAAGDAEPPG